jgi:integrase
MLHAEQQNDFLSVLQHERGFSYLRICLIELPCVNWLDLCAKMYRRNKKATTALMCCKAMYYLASAYKITKRACPNNELTQIIANHDVNKALQLLDDFVSYCDIVKHIEAGSISVHVKAIKRVLRYAGIKIDKDEFKDKVIMPKPSAPIEEYPTNEQITRIANFLTPRKRGALFTINDTGLGRSEVIRLRPKDFHFNEDPVRIETHRFKTGEYIETYCSIQTANTVKQIISHYNVKPDQYIFVRKIGKSAEDKFSEAYIDALKKAGLNQKLEMRVGDEIKEHAYYKFHIHIYRKRWFTKAINVVPAYVAHAMLGRKQYLDQYLAHPLSERQVFYKKISKHVGLFESNADKQEVLDKTSEILGIKIDEKTLKQLKEALSLANQWATLKLKNKAKIDSLLESEST